VRADRFGASAWITTTAAGNSAAIKSALQNPDTSDIAALVVSARADHCPLGNANFVSVHLRRVVDLANGVDQVPGLPAWAQSNREIVGSRCRLWRDNASDGGVVTAITGTLVGQMGYGSQPGQGSTAAGFAAHSISELVHSDCEILTPGQSLAICGSQTGMYMVPTWSWWEIPMSSYLKHPPHFWAGWVRHLSAES